MNRLGIHTGSDLRERSLAFLSQHFGKSGPWYYAIARGEDDRPVRPDRERKSSGSETTFQDDLTDSAAIEAGVLGQADEVWAWCQKANAYGRTVTVKIKYADFQIATRSRSVASVVASQAELHLLSLELIRSVYPLRKGIRLVGVSISNFDRTEVAETNRVWRYRPDTGLVLRALPTPNFQTCTEASYCAFFAAKVARALL